MTGRERMHAATGDEVLRNKRSQVLRLFAIVFALMAGLAIVLGAIFSDARAQDAPQYTFTKVLDSGDGYDPFGFECTAINSRGDIAIRTERVDPEDEFNTSEVIVRASAAGGGLTTIVDEEADGTRFIGRNPDINDTGDVSFAARLPGSRNEIIARGRGGPLTPSGTSETSRMRTASAINSRNCCAASSSDGTGSAVL